MLRRLLLSGLLLASLAGAALAPTAGHAAAAPSGEDKDMVTPDPPKFWRKIAQDSATSTCIGTTTTPLCAAETLMACFVRGIGEMCRQAMGRDSRIASGVDSKPPLIEMQLYRIISSRRLSESDAPPNQQQDEWTAQAGDVRIVIADVDCFTSEAACAEETPWNTIYILRPTTNGWRVIDWYPGNISSPVRRRH